MAIEMGLFLFLQLNIKIIFTEAIIQHIERTFECKSGKYGMINTEAFHLNSPTLPTATALPGSSNELVHTFGWQATF